MKHILAGLLALSVPISIGVAVASPLLLGKAVMLVLAALAAVTLVELLDEMHGCP